MLHMKGCRKCYHRYEDDDSVSHMSEINKGAQKIMTGIPDQLTTLFKWIVLVGVFLFLLIIVCLALKFESSKKLTLTSKETAIPVPSALYNSEPLVVMNVTIPEFCSTVSKNLHSLEKMGYVDINFRESKLMTLDFGVDDVHYVFMNSTHVPWLFTCSLESVLKSVYNKSRINVIVVDDLIFNHSIYDKQYPVPLSSAVADLTATYGENRLNVVHVNMTECLEFSMYRNINLNNRPGLAKFVVQLMLLWQFGGTVLDPGVIANRGRVYRASDSVVEYGDRTISTPIACHEFIYRLMLNTKDLILNGEPFNAKTLRTLFNHTVKQFGPERTARPVADDIVCRDGMVGGSCYYVDADETAPTDPNAYVRDFCPIVSRSPSSRRTGNHTSNLNYHIGDRNTRE